MVSADSTAKSQLPFVIKKIKGKHVAALWWITLIVNTKVRGPNLGQVLIRDTSSFSPFSRQRSAIVVEQY